MSIVYRKRGENISLANDVNFMVMEIGRCEVKLGVCVTSLGQGVVSMLDHVGEVCRDSSCYFLFPQDDGCRTLVIGCAIGQSLSLRGIGTLSVLNIGSESVTMEVTTERADTHSCVE